MKPILRNPNQNKTEAAYDERLRLRQLAGEIVAYRFELLKIILVHNVAGQRNEMTYRPDFLVIKKDCFEIHEVKGFWREDARAKIKMAAELLPWFKFVAVQYKKKQWVFEEF